jgi:murein DD-endopeptidase MepM/ murein hydrolase activator NlpD
MLKYRATLFLIVILVGAAAVYLFMRDGKSPRLTFSPSDGSISANSPPTLTVQDTETGLKDLVVTITRDDKTMSLLHTAFPKGTTRYMYRLPLNRLGLEDGPLIIDIKARDNAFLANSAKQKLTVTLDSLPPAVSVLTTSHNINQGGSGLVMFRVSEKVRRAGIQVGNRFFPAFPRQDGVYACLFAFPHDVKPAEFQPRLVAVDLAGNERISGISYNARLKPPKSDRITLTKSFLTEKAPDFQRYFPETRDPLQLFLRVNGDLRAANVAKLGEFPAKTACAPLWQGVFLRLPKAAPRAGFNDQRDYYFDGKKVDHQTHLGLDLASLAASPVPAANSGTVVFASELGIYGQCVIIDHGLGLQSLYSHLSSIGVTAGAKVSKGQIIGRTGATGMAGGDHLHFGILLNGIEVAPLEWLDQHWITDNFTTKWNGAAGKGR